MDIDYAFERKPLDNLKGVIGDKVDIILFVKDNNYELVGSSSYRLNKNYGDIDILETLVYDNKNKATIGKKIVKKLRIVVADIKKKRMCYFTDFKAGIDHRFIIEGYFKYPPSRDARLISIQTGRANLDYLYRNKLINDEDHNMLKQCLANFTQDDFYTFKEYFKMRQKIRWTEAEIKRGTKKLVGNLTVKLEDAIVQNSVVKIDYVTTLGNQFMEISNFLLIGNVGKNGEVKLFNEKEEEYVEVLKEDVNKLLFTNFFINPLKGVKRMFNICKIYHRDGIYREEVHHIMKKLIIPVISGDINYLNRMASSLDAILLIKSNLPKTSVRNYLKLLNFEVPNCLVLTSANIEYITKKVNAAIKTDSISIIRKNIDTIIEYMKDIIKSTTTRFMEIKRVNTKQSLSIFIPAQEDPEEPSYDVVPSDIEESSTYMSENDSELYSSSYDDESITDSELTEALEQAEEGTVDLDVIMSTPSARHTENYEADPYESFDPNIFRSDQQGRFAFDDKLNEMYTEAIKSGEPEQYLQDIVSMTEGSEQGTPGYDLYNNALYLLVQLDNNQNRDVLTKEVFDTSFRADDPLESLDYLASISKGSDIGEAATFLNENLRKYTKMSNKNDLLGVNTKLAKELRKDATKFQPEDPLGYIYNIYLITNKDKPGTTGHEMYKAAKHLIENSISEIMLEIEEDAAKYNPSDPNEYIENIEEIGRDKPIGSKMRTYSDAAKKILMLKDDVDPSRLIDKLYKEAMESGNPQTYIDYMIRVADNNENSGFALLNALIYVQSLL